MTGVQTCALPICDGRQYVLVDTAGVRRKSKVHETIEKFSIIKALQAMERSQVVLAVLDAQEGVTEQDVSLMGLAVERGRAMVVVTHYQRLLNYIVPDFVHVLSDGRIVKSGGKELALELEEKGYGWIESPPAAASSEAPPQTVESV